MGLAGGVHVIRSFRLFWYLGLSCSALAFSLHTHFGKGDLNYEPRSESCMRLLAPFGVVVPTGKKFTSAESPWLNKAELFLVPKELP